LYCIYKCRNLILLHDSLQIKVQMHNWKRILLIKECPILFLITLYINYNRIRRSNRQKINRQHTHNVMSTCEMFNNWCEHTSSVEPVRRCVVSAPEMSYLERNDVVHRDVPHVFSHLYYYTVRMNKNNSWMHMFILHFYKFCVD
jgi:hypothetical protein